MRQFTSMLVVHLPDETELDDAVLDRVVKDAIESAGIQASVIQLSFRETWAEVSEEGT